MRVTGYRGMDACLINVPDGAVERELHAAMTRCSEANLQRHQHGRIQTNKAGAVQGQKSSVRAVDLAACQVHVGRH